MADFLRLFGLSIVVLLVCLVVRQANEQFALLLLVGAAFLLLAGLMSLVAPLLQTAKEFAARANLPSETFVILLKGLGIALLAQTATDLCVDCHAQSLAGKVELAGKLGILVVGMPLIWELYQMATGLLSGG